VSMELRQLRSFVVVAEELHVGRAAARLHLTQPSLSRQIAALERDVGVPLFARVRRRFRLTPAGEVFLDNAREIVRRADAAVVEAERAHRGEVGTLRLRFVQSATFGALPQVLGPFRAAYPDVTLDLRTMTTLEQTVELREGRADAGLLRLPGDDHDLRTRVISQDPLVAVLPGGHPLTRRRRLPLVALAEEPFVLYTRSSGPSVNDAIIGHCMAAGFIPHVVQEAPDVQTIVSLVASGIGVSLLISPTPPTAEESVAYRPLTDKLPPWELALAWSPRNRSPALAKFLEVAVPAQ
jgi:DNA-binding transcriptional LysR family regulator